MSSTGEHVCVGCAVTEETARLEHCPMCLKWVCPDCVYKATGRRFCSPKCAKTFFYGDTDDLEDFEPDEIHDDD
jgi:hypothetical protein